MAAADGCRPARGVDRDRVAADAAEKAGLELSSASVSALFTRELSQVKMTMLAALCTALECTPNDLIEVDSTPVERPLAPPRPVADVPHAACRMPPPPGAGRCRLCDRRAAMGKKQRDCVTCGAHSGVGPPTLNARATDDQGALQLLVGLAVQLQSPG
ncbi:helix-turn-helix domain-containing protein [Actinacidiphila glaucinigra]|uniref:helix-turn-helix domain-containing protein n=1 Tax=Actinacidiphila glaucinigra TaxID=235986 RepID=UPI001FE3656D|nr:helix-turn-helix transcriptional regulator [Actinacidiphila glaucinigra]